MITVTITKGLPASGKTTWAKKMIAKNPGMYKRINKDDLRSMLDAGKWSKENEKMVLRIRDMLILEALKDGKHVIIDDTNLHHKHEQQIKELVKGKAQVKIKDFTDVSVDECVRRDLQRLEYVGEKTIRKMYKQFIQKKIEKPAHNPKLPECIIVDIDGTLALFGDNNPYERDFIKDERNGDVCDLVWVLHKKLIEGNHEVVFVSGRSGKYEEVTRLWLCENVLTSLTPEKIKIFMRKEGDNRKDVVVKREMYEENIKNKYNVWFVLDDRNQTVEGWRSLGLTCLQVADGDF